MGGGTSGNQPVLCAGGRGAAGPGGDEGSVRAEPGRRVSGLYIYIWIYVLDGLFLCSRDVYIYVLDGL